jgi:predicted DNA-binding transcriptional regulator AlpA
MNGQAAITVLIDYELLADAIAKRLPAPGATGAAPPEEYWSTKEIQAALGIKSRKTVYDVVKKKGFPEPKYFTKERRWKAAEVLDWAARQ